MSTRAGRGFWPGLWPTLIAGAGIVVLLGLGTWQVQRLHWKEALIAEREARAAAAPVTLPGAISDPAAAEFRHITLTGRFRHDREFYLEARARKGRAGLHVVTPLVLGDGRVLLVDRGWVPPARRTPETRADGQAHGLVTVSGHLRRGGWGGSTWFRPENQPAANAWLWLDLPAMAAESALDGVVTELYLVAGSDPNPGGLPKGSELRVRLRNDHLQYAITWYGLALVLLVIYVLYQVRAARGPDVERGDHDRL